MTTDDKKPTIHRTQREVIEGKLLAALDDEAKVAIVADEWDIPLLIDALNAYVEYCPSKVTAETAETLANDLRTLRKEAFDGHPLTTRPS